MAACLNSSFRKEHHGLLSSRERSIFVKIKQPITHWKAKSSSTTHSSLHGLQYTKCRLAYIVTFNFTYKAISALS